MNITKLSQGNSDGLKRQVGECIDSAFRRGYLIGREAEQTNYNSIKDEIFNDAYAKGLNDAWDAVKRLHQFGSNYTGDDTRLVPLYSVLFGVSDFRDIFIKYDITDIISKLDEHDVKTMNNDEEIRCYDEVITADGTKYVVLNIFSEPDTYVLLQLDNLTYHRKHRTELNKTGVHYDELENTVNFINSNVFDL